jgi:hypothetical protein
LQSAYALERPKSSALTSKDRQRERAGGIYNVEQQLKDWHRYAVVYQRDRADLVFLVRKGLIASVTGRVDVGTGGRPREGSPAPPDPTRSNPSIGVGVDAEAGPAEDLLDVDIVDPSGRTIGPIWSYSLKDGLDAPAVPLFQRLKHEVVTTYPK